jgi:hypothetical protein
MGDYTKHTWVNSGSLAINATRLNEIESGIKDAAQDSKQKAALSSRPAAATGNKNWLWIDQQGNVSYSDGSGWSDTGAAPRLTAKAATQTATISNPGTATFDGVTLSNGDVLLVLANATGSQNGPWVFNGSGVAMTRPTWWPTGGTPRGDIEFFVQSGTVHGGSRWRVRTNGYTIDTTAIVLERMSTPPLVTSGSSFGTGIYDGEVRDYLVDSTKGVVWRFRYRSGSGAASKWEFVGGAELQTFVATDESVAGNSTPTYAALATAQGLAIPLIGDYEIHLGAMSYRDGAGAGFTGFMTPSGLGVTASDANAASVAYQANAGFGHVIASKIPLTVTSAGTLSVLFRGDGNGMNFHFLRRFFGATPVRVN